MVWVKFNQEYDHKIKRNLFKNFKAERIDFVTTAIAEAAIKLGKATKINKPANAKLKKNGEVIFDAE